MMPELTPEGQHIITQVAQRHGVSADAVLTLLRALVAGHDTMAQFTILNSAAWVNGREAA
jgi:hypothetical protein